MESRESIFSSNKDKDVYQPLADFFFQYFYWNHCGLVSSRLWLSDSTWHIPSDCAVAIRIWLCVEMGRQSWDLVRIRTHARRSCTVILPAAASQAKYWTLMASRRSPRVLARTARPHGHRVRRETSKTSFERDDLFLIKKCALPNNLFSQLLF